MVPAEKEAQYIRFMNLSVKSVSEDLQKAIKFNLPTTMSGNINVPIDGEEDARAYDELI